MNSVYLVALVASGDQRTNAEKQEQKGIKWFTIRALLKRNIGFKCLWRKHFINIRSDGKTKRISKSYVFQVKFKHLYFFVIT